MITGPDPRARADNVPEDRSGTSSRSSIDEPQALADSDDDQGYAVTPSIDEIVAASLSRPTLLAGTKKLASSLNAC